LLFEPGRGFKGGGVWIGGKKNGSVAFTFPSVALVTNCGVEKVPVPGLPESDEEPEIAEAWQPMQLIAVGPLNENCGSGHPFIAGGGVGAAAPHAPSTPTTAQDQPSHQRFESLIITLQKQIGELATSSSYSSLMTTEPSGI